MKLVAKEKVKRDLYITFQEFGNVVPRIAVTCTYY